jgi:hypothetical protein
MSKIYIYVYMYIVKGCHFYLKYVFILDIFNKMQWEICDYIHCDICSVIVSNRFVSVVNVYEAQWSVQNGREHIR